MSNKIILPLTLTALSLWIQTAQSNDVSEQARYPKIAAQPEDQGVFEGSAATFEVKAASEKNLSFQWHRNGVAMEGQTNSILTLENVGTNDVALYSCTVSDDAEVVEAVPTRAASLSVLTAAATGQIIVYGTPVVGGGKRGSCPGSYVGYVNYTKTVPAGWGWVPSAGTTTHTASDLNRSDTKVAYTGRYLDSGCAQTTVSVPDPAPSPSYRFTVFFPSNMPTNSYPITLVGFDP